MVKSFHDLIVWQKSFDLVKDVYNLSSQLPESEKFGLTNQIRRCSISIPSNIAEGSKRGSRKDYAQFLRIANGSSAELETQLLLIKVLYNISTDDVLLVVVEIQKILNSIIRKLNTTT